MSPMKIFRVILPLLVAGCSSDSDMGSTVPISPGSFLSSSTYASLVIELVSVNGFSPSAATVDNLKTFLLARLNKPAGITIMQSTMASPGKTVYNLNDIKSIENAERKQKPSGTTLTAFVLVLDGDYEGNSGSSKILGLAYGGSSMSLFEKTIQAFSGGVGEPTVTTLETTVIEHEFGHVLGLVNNGSSLQSAHQDGANGKHCTNQNCLMYYSVETSDVVASLLGGSVPALDAACLADLQANGGK